MALKSRILEFISIEVMMELNKICTDVLIPDNNTKVDMICAVLNRYEISYSELGPGTNRFAILIDGYVFKIAMDKAGVYDNWSEFSLTEELQPYVTKVYECNGLLCVSEYVTVVSREEFEQNKSNFRKILSILAESYLFGDVGTVGKNFMNWGYRDDGSLVILDFAYVYRIRGEEMRCGHISKAGVHCDEFLNYDENFFSLVCPRCRIKYSFTEIRNRINADYESKEISGIKELTTKLTTSIELNVPIVEPDDEDEIEENTKGDDSIMARDNYIEPCELSEEELEDLYMNALNFVTNMYSSDEPYEPTQVDINSDIIKEFEEELSEEENEVLISSDDFNESSVEPELIQYEDDDDDEEWLNDPDQLMEDLLPTVEQVEIVNEDLIIEPEVVIEKETVIIEETIVEESRTIILNDRMVMNDRAVVAPKISIEEPKDHVKKEPEKSSKSSFLLFEDPKEPLDVIVEPTMFDTEYDEMQEAAAQEELQRKYNSANKRNMF